MRLQCRAATPTMSERISKESVTGRVNDIGAKYISIKDKPRLASPGVCAC